MSSKPYKIMLPFVSASDLSEDIEKPNKNYRCRTLSGLLIRPRNPRQCCHCINMQETDPVNFCHDDA